LSDTRWPLGAIFQSGHFLCFLSTGYAVCEQLQNQPQLHASSHHRSTDTCVEGFRIERRRPYHQQRCPRLWWELADASHKSTVESEVAHESVIFSTFSIYRLFQIRRGDFRTSLPFTAVSPCIDPLMFISPRLILS